MKLMKNTNGICRTIFATDQAWEEEAASLAADIKAASHYAGHFVGFSANTFGYNQCILELSRRLEKGLTSMPI